MFGRFTGAQMLVLGVVAGCVLLFFAESAHADVVLYSQLDSTASSTVSGSNQYIGTGLSGSVKSVTTKFYVRQSFGSSTDNMVLVLRCFNTSTYGASPCSNPGEVSNTVTITSTATNQRFTNVYALPVQVTLDPTKFYWIQGECNASGSAISGCVAPNVNANYSANGTTGAVMFTCAIACGGLTSTYYTVNGPNPPTSSVIDAMSPLDASTTASATVSLSVTYDLVATSTYGTVGIFLSDVTTGYIPLAPILASTTAGTSQTFSTTTTLISGHAYAYVARLLGTTDAYGVSYGDVTNTVGACSATAGAGTCLFSVVSNPLGAALGVNAINASSTFGLATSTCSITNVTGCIQNALVFVFYPSQSSLTLVAQGGNSVKNKPPFGWLFVNIAAIQSLNASGTAPVALAVDAPIVTYIFGPLDVALGAVFFFFFSVWIFLRVRRIEL